MVDISDTTFELGEVEKYYDPKALFDRDLQAGISKLKGRLLSMQRQLPRLYAFASSLQGEMASYEADRMIDQAEEIVGEASYLLGLLEAEAKNRWGSLKEDRAYGWENIGS